MQSTGEESRSTDESEGGRKAERRWLKCPRGTRGDGRGPQWTPRMSVPCTSHVIMVTHVTPTSLDRKSGALGVEPRALDLDDGSIPTGIVLRVRGKAGSRLSGSTAGEALKSAGDIEPSKASFSDTGPPGRSDTEHLSCTSRHLILGFYSRPPMSQGHYVVGGAVEASGRSSSRRLSQSRLGLRSSDCERPRYCALPLHRKAPSIARVSSPMTLI